MQNANTQNAMPNILLIHCGIFLRLNHDNMRAIDNFISMSTWSTHSYTSSNFLSRYEKTNLLIAQTNQAPEFIPRLQDFHLHPYEYLYVSNNTDLFNFYQYTQFGLYTTLPRALLYFSRFEINFRFKTLLLSKLTFSTVFDLKTPNLSVLRFEQHLRHILNLKT